jgi:hypothetical protein
VLLQSFYGAKSPRSQGTPSLLDVPCDLSEGDARDYHNAPDLKDLSNTLTSRAISSSAGVCASALNLSITPPDAQNLDSDRRRT